MSWHGLRSRWRQLVGFALLFQALEGLLFAPLAAVVGSAMLGRPVVDSTALLSFLLSPRGALVVFLGATASLTIRMLSHAGLSVIALGALEGRTVRATAALRALSSANCPGWRG